MCEKLKFSNKLKFAFMLMIPYNQISSENFVIPYKFQYSLVLHSQFIYLASKYFPFLLQVILFQLCLQMLNSKGIYQ